MTRRAGLIVPSSNTVLEPEVARLGLGGSIFVTRVRVTEISLSAAALGQFDVAPMRDAAGLLGDARVDAVAWAGTAGSWLGLDHDRRLVDVLSSAAGAPATTSTLAVLGALEAAGVSRIGLLTPYVTPVVSRIAETFASAGVSVAAESHLGLTENHAFAAVSTPVLARMADSCGGSGAEALVVLCTNVRGAGLVCELPVFDSVTVTLKGVACAT